MMDDYTDTDTGSDSDTDTTDTGLLILNTDTCSETDDDDDDDDGDNDDDEIVLITHATSRLSFQPKSKRQKLTRLQKVMRKKSTEMTTLSWYNCYPVVPLESESALLPILFPFGNVERGMMRHHPSIRVTQINESCEMHGMQLEQALSLRRQHMKLLNSKFNDVTQLGLGNSDDICEVEELFKYAVLKYIKKSGVRLKKLHKGNIVLQVPDFLLKYPVRLITYQTMSEDSNFGEHGQVNWIEAEMCYGASTVHCETSSTIDAIISKAKNYVKRFGPGAFVFAYGCGSKLREQLRALRITVLDSHPLDLKKVKNHQRKWCADNRGSILP